MLNIEPFKINQNQNSNRQNKLKFYCSNFYSNDTFEKNNPDNISFGKHFSIFKKYFFNTPEITVLDGVSAEYENNIKDRINKFPKKMLKTLKNKNFKIILSPTIIKAYESQNVCNPLIEFYEKEKPKETLSSTYSDKEKNFIVFCDKPPYSNKYMNNIVNHELSQGVVKCLELDKSPVIKDVFEKDIESIKKENNLKSKEKYFLSHYILKTDPILSYDEILADICAWNLGGGIYGSGLILNINNPDLMKNIFPKTSAILKEIN